MHNSYIFEMKILQGDIGEHITLSEVQGNREFIINSYGGSLFEGLAIYDFLKNQNPNIGVAGVCASAATVVLLASPNRWGTPNSRYLIHNPGNPYGGTAEQMRRSAEQLQAEEHNIVRIYAEHLKLSVPEIIELMKNEQYLNAEKALEIGLITEIKELTAEMKLQPIINLKNNRKMQENEVKKELSLLRGIVNKISTLFSPQMIVIQDVNGVELEFPELENESQIVVGVYANTGDSPANGEFVTKDGKTLVFENGYVVEIKEPIVEETAKTEETPDVTAENEALKTENNALKLTVTEIKNEVESLKKDIARFQMLVTKEAPKTQTPETQNTDTPVKRVTWKK